VQDFSLTFQNIWLFIAIVLGIILLAGTLFYYRKTYPPVSKATRVVLALLRASSIILLLFVLAEPVLSYFQVRDLPPKVAVLFDNSESVKTVDNFDIKRDQLSLLIDQYFTDPEKGLLVKDNYEFSDSLRSLGDSLSFDGKQTSLGSCLHDLKSLYEGQNLQGVIIVSDGLVNSGKNPLKAASELSVPVHTVDLGPQRSSQDMRIVRVNHDEVGYDGRSSDIELEIESRGFEDLVVPIRVRSGGKTISNSEVRLTGKSARQTVTFGFVPNGRGIQTFSVSLPAQPEEELTENNKRSFSMKILKSKQRILLAAGYLSWECTFLRRVLDMSYDFECDVSVFDRTQNLKTTPFPRTAEKLSEYDLIILLDYSPSIIASRIEALSGYLSDHGKAGMFVLGTEFSKAGLPSDLAKLMPYDFQAGSSIRAHGDFHLRLTEQGKLHPITQIDETVSRLQESWDDLPPFEVFLDVGREKAGTTVLAVHPEPDTGGRMIPLLLVSRVGRVKVLTASFSPLWKTDFVSRGRGGSGGEYKNFIRNCVRWLVTTDDTQRIRISPDKTVFKSGERTTFSASLLDESYQAIDNGSVVLTVYPDSGTASDTLMVSMVRTGPGKMKADLHLLNHGQYGYTARFIRGDEVTETSGRFTVEAFSLEEETLFETVDLLREIAAVTGGIHYPVSMLDSLVNQIGYSPGEQKLRREHPLSHHWVLVLLILLFLSAEWTIRKRLQLM